MTVSSTAKDNPKTSKKATKQPSAISSSLKSIMKHGGNVSALREGGSKKLSKGKTISRDTDAKKHADKKTIDDKMGDDDVDMDKKTEEMKKEKEFSATEKGEKTMVYIPEETGGWDIASNSTKPACSKETVNVWEKEIERLEKEATRATTSEYRKLMENKIHEAQVMLKKSLLMMTAGTIKETTNDSEKTDRTEESNMVIDLTVNESTTKSSEAAGPNKTKNKEDDVVSMMTGENNTKKQTTYDARRNMVTFNWAEESDDETVIQHNQPTEPDVTWETVKNKKYSKNKNNEAEKVTIIQNPYNKRNSKGDAVKPKDAQGEGMTGAESNSKSSLATFMEVVKGKMRSENNFLVRINMSFTPRTAGSGEYLRIARELLSFGKEIDPDILLLPWVETPELSPINIDDLANSTNHSSNIKQYINKPPYINWRPGSPVYGIGVRFSTNFGKYEFMNRWNLKKQEFKNNNRAAYSITLAPMQKSSSAYIIGIAVGSTEKQDFETLNERLQEVTGIEGIEVSFQNINQAGVTQEFWKIANEQATLINADKFSRDHLREKYRWAPNALAIYVPTKELVPKARKTMLKMYGKSIDGYDPIWPDGSSMRFLPIKGQAIRNEKTRNIVRKRLAYHIWIKVNEISIDTNMANIHRTIEAFGGLTFAEIVLQTTNEKNQRVFSHFNRVWSNDPSNERWAISVKNQVQESANTMLANLQDELYDKYGPDIEQFFKNDRTSQNWKDAILSKQTQQDDEDDWFDDDDDIDEVVKNGLVDSAFLRLFKPTPDEEEDRKSIASWGTGNTAYTEIVTTQEMAGTVHSSITQETPKLTDEEIDSRKAIVRVRLLLKGVKDVEIDEIMANKTPYELAFSGIQLPSWDPDKEVLMLLAIRNQFSSTPKHNHE